MTVTDPVRMAFSLQDPFNFNVEFSVSWCDCRYHDPAGFMPRVAKIFSGAPGISEISRPDQLPLPSRTNTSVERHAPHKGNAALLHHLVPIYFVSRFLKFPAERLLPVALH